METEVPTRWTRAEPYLGVAMSVVLGVMMAYQEIEAYLRTRNRAYLIMLAGYVLFAISLGGQSVVRARINRGRYRSRVVAAWVASSLFGFAIACIGTWLRLNG